MKKRIRQITATTFVVGLICLLFGCGTSSNDEETIKWIENNRKPIICTKTTMNGWTYNWRYSLMSADNKFYSTGEISLALPDTIYPQSK